MDLTTLIVAGLALGILLHLSMRQIMVLLGKSPLRNGFDAGPDAVNPDLVPTLDADLFNDMLALGFKPLGIYWEQIAFSKRFHEYIFVRPGEPCYGTIHRADFSKPRAASFFTVFPDGAVAHTKNFPGGFDLNLPDFIVEGAQHFEEGQPPRASEFDPPDADFDITDVRISLAAVFERQRENVNRLIFRGHTPPEKFDAEAFCEAQHAYYEHPALRQEHRTAELATLIHDWFGHGFLPAIVACFTGITHVAPWCVLLVEALYALGKRYAGGFVQRLGQLVSRERSSPS
jgi:hypothetical protein